MQIDTCSPQSLRVRQRHRRHSDSDVRSSKVKRKLKNSSTSSDSFNSSICKDDTSEKVFSDRVNKNYRRVLLDKDVQISKKKASDDQALHNSNQSPFPFPGLKTKTKKLINEFRKRVLRQHYVYVHLDDGSVAADTVKALGLEQKHLKKLKMKFDKIDIDHSGTIEAAEFFSMFNEEPSPFTKSLFSFLDLNNSGYIDFDEFVRVCGRYCMYTKHEILRFWFDCYDEDGSGAIDEDEFVELCRAVNNKSPMFPGNFAQALSMFDINEDGLIDFQEFIELHKRFPLILYPAFRFQETMQKLTLGEQGWTEIIERICVAKQKKSIEKKKRIRRKLRKVRAVLTATFLGKRKELKVVPLSDPEEKAIGDSCQPDVELFEKLKQGDRQRLLDRKQSNKDINK